jgi:hypothetical protein
MNFLNSPFTFTHTLSLDMKKILGISAILVFSISISFAQQGSTKKHGEKSTTLVGSGSATSATTEPVQKAVGKAGSDDAPAQGNGQSQGQVNSSGGTDAMPDAVTVDALDDAKLSTEGMSPAQAAKAKYMHNNERLKARNNQAEAKLAESKAKIAKSKSSLESKKKKGKISAAEYESGMAKIKVAEEKLQYLETMVGESKQKTF